MLSPRLGSGVCETCLTFTDGYPQCYVCSRSQPWLDAVLPISYSVAHEQLHHALAAYKRLSGEVAQRLRRELAAVLWRFLDRHESCVAARAGVSAFEVVTTVPAGRSGHDAAHPLAEIVGQTCEPTRGRYRRLLDRTEVEAEDHEFHPGRYQPLARPGGQPTLDGQSVLLIDDTWTTGSSAQSAAAALKRAGAGAVALVVIGRHLKRDWRSNDTRLQRLTRPFDWTSCVYCAQAGGEQRATGTYGAQQRVPATYAAERSLR